LCTLFQGVCIHAAVSKKLLSNVNFDLQRGKVIVLSNFTLLSNLGRYRTCMHPFKIRFKDSTVGKIMEDDPNISSYGFNFVAFPDITSNTHDDNFLVG